MRNIPIFEKNLDIFLLQIVCAKPLAPQAAVRGSGMSGEHAQEGFVELAIMVEDRRAEAFVVPGDDRLVHNVVVFVHVFTQLHLKNLTQQCVKFAVCV